MRRMQAAGIDAFGGELRTLELAAPGSPAPDEVVVSVHAAGVGNWDEFVRTGDWDVGRRPPLAPGALVARKPAVVPWEQAAAFPVPALTADQALQAAAPAPDGQWVLVHGAGGVTGGLTVQLAVARGATVVATAGPPSGARGPRAGARGGGGLHE